MPNPSIFIISVIRKIFVIFLKSIKKTDSTERQKCFCMYPPAIASCPKKPLYLSSNGLKPNMSWPIKCCKKISRDKNIDDNSVIIDNNFKFTILLLNKFLIIKKNKANRKSNRDLIKIMYKLAT